MLNYLRKWIDQLRWQRLPAFQKLAEMLLKHLDGILNYCRTKVRFGVVEAINGNIRMLINRGRGYDQMSNRATAPGQRQRSAIHARTFTEHDQVRHHVGAADTDAFFAEDGSPERRNFDVGAEDGEQVALGGATLVCRLPNKTICGQPDPSGRVLQALLELCEPKTLMCILHSISAVSPFANATANSWTNCSRSRMMIFSSSVSSVLMTLFLVFHAAT